MVNLPIIADCFEMEPIVGECSLQQDYIVGTIFNSVSPGFQLFEVLQVFIVHTLPDGEHTVHEIEQFFVPGKIVLRKRQLHISF